MAAQTFVDKVTVIPTAWLNDVNALTWTVFNGKSTAGTSGTILRSNGTNIVNTTATFPTTTTANQLLYSSATNTIGGLTSANNSVLVTNGSGVPSFSTTLPTGLTISGLATDLAIADGGTGQSSATAAFDALAPTTTTGDIIYYNGTDNIRLGVGATNYVLTVVGGVPTWQVNQLSSTVAFTNASTIDIDVSSFKFPRIYLRGVSLLADASISITWSYDGTTFESSGYGFNRIAASSSTVGAGSANSAANVTMTGTIESSNFRSNGYIDVMQNANNTNSIGSSIYWVFHYQSTAPNQETVMGTATCFTITPGSNFGQIKKIRLTTSASTFTSAGTVTIVELATGVTT